MHTRSGRLYGNSKQNTLPQQQHDGFESDEELFLTRKRRVVPTHIIFSDISSDEEDDIHIETNDTDFVVDDDDDDDMDASVHRQVDAVRIQPEETHVQPFDAFRKSILDKNDTSFEKFLIATKLRPALHRGNGSLLPKLLDFVLSEDIFWYPVPNRVGKCDVCNEIRTLSTRFESNGTIIYAGRHCATNLENAMEALKSFEKIKAEATDVLEIMFYDWNNKNNEISYE